jgi:hypothetical protein
MQTSGSIFEAGFPLKAVRAYTPGDFPEFLSPKLPCKCQKRPKHAISAPKNETPVFLSQRSSFHRSFAGLHNGKVRVAAYQHIGFGFFFLLFISPFTPFTVHTPSNRSFPCPSCCNTAPPGAAAAKNSTFHPPTCKTNNHQPSPESI